MFETTNQWIYIYIYIIGKYGEIWGNDEKNNGRLMAN